MKILFIGSTRRTALALHYFTNLVRVGYKVIPFDPDYFATTRLWQRAAVRMKRAPLKSRSQRISQELVRLCDRNRFDVVFSLAENFLEHTTIEAMKRVSKVPPFFVYHSHDNNFAPGILKPAEFTQTLQSYDLVFTTKSQNVARYHEMGLPQSYYLASAYEPAVHHPITEPYSVYAKTPFDVSFVGTYDSSRLPYLEMAGWERLHVFGDHWKRMPKFAEHKAKIHSRAVYDFEFADITSHSKINLGLLREEAQDLHTTRTFEIPACGGFQLAPRNDEIKSYLKENEEVVLFSSPEEMKDKIDYYLNHEWQRNQIARKGYERVMRDKHSYLDRVKEIFRKVEEKMVRSVNVPQPTFGEPLAERDSATLAR